MTHEASGMFALQTQSGVHGQSFSERVDTAPKAALLPSVTNAYVVPLATGSGQKRKTHECQAHEDHIDIAMEEMLPDLPTPASVADARCTDCAGNSSFAAHAGGQCIESDSAQMQLLGDEQNWQPKKKIKIGFTSSRAVYRGSALDAANDPIQSPKMSAAPFLAQGSPVAAPSRYNHSSMRG